LRATFAEGIAVIIFEHVTKRYPGGTVAVDDLSLEVPDGKIMVLVGPSGCGKTTTLRMVNRLVELTEGLRDTAAGVGMTRWQQVLRAEVPVALPLIIVGLRTAAIFIVSTATIAAYIGLGGLGRYVFDGLAGNDYGEVAGGAALVVLLALAVLPLAALARRLAVPAGLRTRECRPR